LVQIGGVVGYYRLELVSVNKGQFTPRKVKAKGLAQDRSNRRSPFRVSGGDDLAEGEVEAITVKRLGRRLGRELRVESGGKAKGDF